MKNNLLPLTLCLMLLALIGCNHAHAQSCTNFYAASEIELAGGPMFSFSNPSKQNVVGTQVGGVFWQSLHYGPGIHAGINNLGHLNALLFDYSQADYNLRWPVWRIAPGARLGIGKDFTDGSNYTEPDATLEFRFTKNLGLTASVGYKFTTTDKAGLLGFFGVTGSF